MAFWNRNPNESWFFGGKKHWIEVIKNSGSDATIVWKQPEEDFNDHSVLIVMPGETALFISNGEILGTFSEGRYELRTENYPFLSRIVNAFSGGISSYNAVVYFVKSSDIPEIGWGTMNPIRVRDKVYDIVTSIAANGSYRVRIVDPELFLRKVIGSKAIVATKEDLEEYISSEMYEYIISVITTLLSSLESDLVDLGKYCFTLSKAMLPKLNDIISSYGLECVSFTIELLESDQSVYEEINKIQMDGLKAERKARSLRNTIDILGSDYYKVKDHELKSKLLDNPGFGDTAAATANFMMGGEAGARMGAFVSGFLHDNAVAASQGQSITNSEISTEKEDKISSIKEQLRGLKELFDEGLITESEYEDKRKDILKSM